MNLESGYHRDLQLTKEPIMTAFETMFDMLDAAELLISMLKVNIPKAEAACTPELLAAEAANLLVLDEKMSFREAYKIIAANPERYQNMKAIDVMKRFTQLGSPGNVGKPD
jgi:argininosuccinate lyase